MGIRAFSWLMQCWMACWPSWRCGDETAMATLASPTFTHLKRNLSGKSGVCRSEEWRSAHPSRWWTQMCFTLGQHPRSSAQSLVNSDWTMDSYAS